MKELIPEVVDILSENDLQFTTLRGAQDTVCLLEGKEHDILKLLQFSQDRRIFLYTTNGSKNQSGRYKDHNEAKQVKHL